MTVGQAELVARGARLLAARPREEVEITCAVREERSGALYLGTTQGVMVVASDGKVSHVKLRGERMQAAAAGRDCVWLAGDEHLVRLETASPRTSKLARSDFGLGGGAVEALLADDDALWVAVRVGRRECPLFRLEPAARRVKSCNVRGIIRGLAHWNGGAFALGDEELYALRADGHVRQERSTADAARAPAEQYRVRSALAELVDEGFLQRSGPGLVGRDLQGLFVLPDVGVAPRQELPSPLASLGTCALRLPDGAWLVGGPLGLMHWGGGEARQLGTAPIVALLAGDPVVAVAEHAAVALGELAADAPAWLPDPERDLPVLARLALKRGSARARVAALTVLEKGLAADPLPLVRGLSDPSPDVRAAACRIAERNQIAAARPLLESLSADPDDEVRARSMQALIALGDRAAGARLAECLRLLPQDEARRMIRELAARGPASIDVLRPFALDGRPVVRRAALLMLGKLGFPREVLGAIAQLERPYPEERELGIENLGRLRDPLVAYLLAAHLADPAASVRRASLCALAEAATRGPIPADLVEHVVGALVPLMLAHPDDPEIAAAGVGLASQLGGVLPPDLVARTLEHPSPVARLAAVRVAEQQRRRDLVPALIGHLGDASLDVRGACVDALGRIGDPRGLKPLKQLLDDPRTFDLRLAGEAGHRAISRSMARILGADVPVEVELGDHDAWAGWYRATLLPLMGRFGFLG